MRFRTIKKSTDWMKTKSPFICIYWTRVKSVRNNIIDFIKFCLLLLILYYKINGSINIAADVI